MINEKVRIHLVVPKHLVEEIDEIAGARHRSAYVAELIERESKLRRRRKWLEEFEKNPPGPWGFPGEEHMDSAEWVHMDRRRGDRIDELWGRQREE